ncbi:MAG: YlbF family regulator [Anaerolineae bacterium]
MRTTEQTQERVTEGEALEAARELAAAVARAAAYQAFDRAQSQMRRDPEAQSAIRTFQEKQQDLAWQVQFGLVGKDGRQELERLQQAMLAKPVVRHYVEAQEELSQLCQEVSELISEVIGLSFAASCGPGCC